MSINKLEELVQPHLENGQKITSYDIKSFLAPGENYGSTILEVNIKVTNKNEEEETIPCVAKTVPQSQAVWEFFNTPVTFKKEIEFYKTIVPILNEFAQENGVTNFMHFLAKCLGARISLDRESDVVDKDAAFVLENLKVQGYILGDRFTGVDLDTTKLLLSALAAQHSAGIALKLTRPNDFEAKILPHLAKGVTYDAPDSMLVNLIKNVQKFVAKDSRCAHLSSRIEKSLKRMKDLYINSKRREPLATILHHDLWINNMMIKFEGEKPVDVKLLDYQFVVYGSPIRDVLFFLYTSTKLEDLEDKIDELLRYCYDKLIDMFTKLNCSLSTSVSFENLMEEADQMARDTEFSHIIFMLTPIFTLRGQELHDWTPDNLAPVESMLHEAYYDRLQFIVRDFARRNWI